MQPSLPCSGLSGKEEFAAMEPLCFLIGLSYAAAAFFALPEH
jgi:hypothetical protein